MNRDEFLTNLRENLNGLPKDDIDERISFYDEMISDLIDDGKTEEEAINEVGPINKIVDEIASTTSLKIIVKEKISNRRKISALEIVLLVLGFPLWLPLLITIFMLLLVAYILIWVGVIITCSVEAGLIAFGIGGIVKFFAYIFNGSFNLEALAIGLLGLGGSLLMFFACKETIKVTIRFSKFIFTKIKSMFIRKGDKK